MDNAGVFQPEKALLAIREWCIITISGGLDIAGLRVGLDGLRGLF